MDNQVYYRIGEFSKLSNLSVRTLRYYDEINLLKPDITDRYSGYRYYTDNNLYEAYLINLLKSVNFSLEEVLMFKNCMDINMVDNKVEELNNSIDELHSKIKRLEIIKDELTLNNDIKKLVLQNNDENRMVA